MKHASSPNPIVTFDLGNVLVRLCPSTQAAAERAGVPWRPPAHPEQPDEVARLLFVWQLGQLTDEALFEAWAHALGGRFDPSEARRISECWLLGEFDGVAELIRQLRQRGVRLGCLSNTCNHHWQWMLDHPDTFPSLSLLDERHASHLLGHMKPDPTIFGRYEQAVACSASEIVFFDDVAENVASARERGWRAFQVLADEPPAPQIAKALDRLGLL